MYPFPPLPFPRLYLFSAFLTDFLFDSFDQSVSEKPGFFPSAVLFAKHAQNTKEPRSGYSSASLRPADTEKPRLIRGIGTLLHLYTLGISYAPGFAADFPPQGQVQQDSESTYLSLGMKPLKQRQTG